MPGQASGASRPTKSSTARFIGGDNEIPTPRMAQPHTQLKDLGVPTVDAKPNMVPTSSLPAWLLIF
ncbi:hypothetical protein I79_008926 [Cricetulus griseus]|uniref:Uncharacterized protein n=1 Tax=Cricetulus griseus TaxID=10029 RepID=G3HEE2_CRIGR|nr:hypothetical protein I79_008926 [Cricetulus griseus]